MTGLVMSGDDAHLTCCSPCSQLGQLLDVRFRSSLSFYAYFTAHMAEGSCETWRRNHLNALATCL
jgi:hypothetical protein